MAMLLKAQKFATEAPREALIDALGFAGICALIFAGFTLPAFF
ncbi:MAG: hypothetical protein ACTSVG_10070 [Alphaproteobacteria bacterium]